MASNFGITIDKNSGGFGLRLAGDFDATSAYELIYAIKKLPEDTVKISVYTNGLESIYPFGLDVLHRYRSPLNLPAEIEEGFRLISLVPKVHLVHAMRIKQRKGAMSWE